MIVNNNIGTLNMFNATDQFALFRKLAIVPLLHKMKKPQTRPLVLTLTNWNTIHQGYWSILARSLLRENPIPEF